MGPFPHDAPPAEITADNPAGTDGFEFVEFAHPEPEKLRDLFTRMGYTPVAKRKSKDITVWRQGDINYILNAEPGSHAMRFVDTHGPCAPSMAWRVVDARHAFDHAVSKGATPYMGDDKALDAPAIVGIGGSLLYFIEKHGEKGSAYDDEFEWLGSRDPKPEGVGFYYLDHLTHNVYRGRMAYWAGFYEKLFNFREIRYFDIKGEYTGLTSKAMTAPDGKIRIPLNEESSKGAGQIEEFLMQFNGEGIQHIALSTDDLIGTLDQLKAAGLPLMSAPPATYYQMLEGRLPGHGEPVTELQSRGILLDGSSEGGQRRLLLQIFSKTLLGPVFFEFIQRKGDDGFGEGNFKALFESIERDQIERGVLAAS